MYGPLYAYAQTRHVYMQTHVKAYLGLHPIHVVILTLIFPH